MRKAVEDFKILKIGWACLLFFKQRKELRKYLTAVQWFPRPKYGSRPKQGSWRVKQWVMRIRFKTELVHFQRYHCLSMPTGLSRFKSILATYCQKSNPCDQYFLIGCLHLGWWGIHPTKIWVVLKKIAVAYSYTLQWVKYTARLCQHFMCEKGN